MSVNHQLNRPFQDIPDYIFKDSGYKIDLHVHSSVSDGLNSPIEVLHAAKDAGIMSLVFTEHNAIHDSFYQLRDIARKIGVDVPMVGVEFSTVYCIAGNPFLKFHLLVYGKSVEQFSFMDDIFNPNSPKNEYLKSMYEKLRDQHLIMKSLKELYKVSDLEAPTRKKMLLRRTLVSEVAMQNGLSEKEVSELYVPKMDEHERYKKYLDIETVISIARKNGCATIIAHPGWIRPFQESSIVSEEDVFQAVVRLARLGLNGIEIVHRLNDNTMREKLYHIARGLQLIVTGGSDYHGKNRCVFGMNGATDKALNDLLEVIS